MKKVLVCAVVWCVAAAGFVQELQGQELPRLAVVEFTSNVSTEKAKADSLTVRNLVESQMVGTGKYQIVTRAEIDQLLSNQKIAVSAISSAENVKKLQLAQISYIVTGSVDVMDADYAVTVKILDVSTGQFSHSANDFMGGSSRELYTGVNTLVANFVKGMSSEGGQVAQAGSRRPQSGVSAAGIGIEVSTVLGGALYFQDEEIAALWDNDTYTIPIERPGTYRIRMVFGNGGAISRNVTITSRGVVKEAFAPPRPPENVKTGTIDYNGIELSWNPAGQGLSYRIYSGTSNNPAGAGFAGTTAGTSYRVSNLRSLTDYYFWVSSQEGPFESDNGQMVTAKSATMYTLGDTGPGGGIVFYDRGNSSSGWRYLEAAPTSAEFKAEWGLSRTSVSGTNTGIGTGKRNTEIIAGRGGTAARRCGTLNTGGYNDWFLPSKDELDLMYRNLKMKGLGGFSSEWYWSSSENGNDYAWYQDFSDGSQYYTNKTNTGSVRAVRAF
jgi:hypothetical protein